MDKAEQLELDLESTIRKYRNYAKRFREEQKERTKGAKANFWSYDVNSVKVYIDQMRNHPLLTEELSARIFPEYYEAKKYLKQNTSPSLEEKMREAKKIITNANLRFVLSVAKEYNFDGNFLDLIQEGNMGLMKAIDKFDPYRKVHFTSYAVWWIRQSILKYIAQNTRTIRFPLNVHVKYMDYMKSVEELEGQLGREPKDEEVADFMKKDIEEIRKLKRLPTTASIDKYMFTEDTNMINPESKAWINFFVDERAMFEEGLLEQLLYEEIDKRFISTLPKRTQEVLRRRELDSLDRIGQSYNLSKERIRQIEQKGINKLKQKIREHERLVLAKK